MDKVIVKNFDVHGLVKIHVESCFQEKIDQIMNHLAEFEVSVNPENFPDVIIQDYRDVPNYENASVIDSIYFYAENWLNMPCYRLCFNFKEETVNVYCDRLILPMNLIMQIALIKKGYSLIHSAGVEFEGKNYLFPAFGGIGKTTLVSAVVFAGGEVYGDDMTIVKNDKVFAYPQDFSVYPYHMGVLKLSDRVIEKHFKRTKILNLITGILDVYDYKPVKLLRFIINSLKVPCVNVPPRRIFGDKNYAGSGVIDEVYYLTRTSRKSKNLEVKRIDPDVLAETCTDILFHEWHQSMHYLYIYCALSSFSLERLHACTRDVFRNLFRNIPCYSMEIPISMTNQEYQQNLIYYLESR